MKNELSFWQSTINAANETAYFSLTFSSECSETDRIERAFNKLPVELKEFPRLTPNVPTVTASHDDRFISIRLDVRNLSLQYMKIPDKTRITNAYKYLRKPGSFHLALLKFNIVLNNPLVDFVISEGNFFVGGPFYVKRDWVPSSYVLELTPAPYTDKLQKQVECAEKEWSAFRKAFQCPFL